MSRNAVIHCDINQKRSVIEMAELPSETEKVVKFCARRRLDYAAGEGTYTQRDDTVRPSTQGGEAYKTNPDSEFQCQTRDFQQHLTPR